jgi:chemotaxis protein MotB
MRFPNSLLAPALAVLLGGAVLSSMGCASARPAADDAAELLREDLQAAYAEIERLRAENAELDYRLRQAMDGAARNGERGQTVAVLPTDIFFESGSAELTAQGVARMGEIARRLQSEFSGREVRIEGYTDNMPIGPNLRAQYPSNWELSAARAATVARALQRAHNLDGRRIEIVGLGEYHPAVSNATPEGRQQNRRVRIAVMGG